MTQTLSCILFGGYQCIINLFLGLLTHHYENLLPSSVALTQKNTKQASSGKPPTTPMRQSESIWCFSIFSTTGVWCLVWCTGHIQSRVISTNDLLAMNILRFGFCMFYLCVWFAAVPIWEASATTRGVPWGVIIITLKSTEIHYRYNQNTNKSLLFLHIHSIEIMLVMCFFFDLIKFIWMGLGWNWPLRNVNILSLCISEFSTRHPSEIKVNLAKTAITMRVLLRHDRKRRSQVP